MQELVDFAEKARQDEKEARYKAADEYDGLSPDEINALAAAKAR